MSPPSLQGPTICLAPRRDQEDCPRLAAPTTTPGTDFDAPRRPSPPRHSGPKPQTLRGAAQPTAMRERGRENGKEKERGRGSGNERKETRPSVKRRRIKTGQFEMFNVLSFRYYLEDIRNFITVQYLTQDFAVLFQSLCDFPKRITSLHPPNNDPFSTQLYHIYKTIKLSLDKMKTVVILQFICNICVSETEINRIH